MTEARLALCLALVGVVRDPRGLAGRLEGARAAAC